MDIKLRQRPNEVKRNEYLRLVLWTI